MKVLLLCGYFEPQYQEERTRKTKIWVENAANTFQQRLIHGLRAQDISLKIVSAPLLALGRPPIRMCCLRDLMLAIVRREFGMCISITFGDIGI